MALIKHLDKIERADLPLTGNKALCLSVMARHSMNVPEAFSVTTDCYNRFVSSTGLREAIMLELNRRPFESMRWEEMWDASLRIRNLFTKTDIGTELLKELLPAVESMGDNPVAVRSSAPDEDTGNTSFAGLHESYVNVRGSHDILKHIRLVWASLWSDAALLYRRELRLDIEKSSMSVLVQRMVNGRCSGVAFGRNPSDPSQCMVEAVHGLNQGMVDGTVEPDRWILDARSLDILNHTPATRSKIVLPTDSGAAIEPIPPELADTAPLKDHEVGMVSDLLARAGKLFGHPQDLEWTFRDNDLFALQSRNITTVKDDGRDDPRSWYLSLRRSYDNLEQLRHKIESEILPGMEAEAARLSETNLSELPDNELAEECTRRREIFTGWKDVYWDDCIPMAHGMRLFGRLYNDTVKPEDPHEFAALLSTGADNLAGMKRNRILKELAKDLHRDNTLLEKLLKHGPEALPTEMRQKFTQLREACALLTDDHSDKQVATLLAQAARNPVSEHSGNMPDPVKLERAFLESLPSEQADFGRKALELGRASYRLRDDDNIYLGLVEAQLKNCVDEAMVRLRKRGIDCSGDFSVTEILKALEKPGYLPKPEEREDCEPAKDDSLSPVQLTGQPAGPGVATGIARVLHDAKDIFSFQAGEILVCDAIDPNMTIVVPLAAAIVERRGGMLIHGAIIAREYGLPCVTGVDNAAELIETGNRLTVDGYLGIVRVSRPTEQP